MSLFHLVYASKANTLIDDQQLHSIQTWAIRNNSQKEVTGLLLYGRGRFIQLLEGDSVAVDGIFGHIEKDDRHTEIDVLFRGSSEKRLFPSWSMGVICMDHAEVDIDIKAIWDSLDVAQAIANSDPAPIYQLFEKFQQTVTTATVPA